LKLLQKYFLVLLFLAVFDVSFDALTDMKNCIFYIFYLTLTAIHSCMATFIEIAFKTLLIQTLLQIIQTTKQYSDGQWWSFCYDRIRYDGDV